MPVPVLALHGDLCYRETRPQQSCRVRLMKTWAVIPARGGSKGIPRKNLRAVGNCSLVSRAVQTALGTNAFDSVIVSTDSDDIAREVEGHGVDVVRRPQRLSGDLASSESAVLHAVEAVATASQTRPELVVMIQCTSPFLRVEDLISVVGALSDFDSVFTAVADHSFKWRKANDGSVVPIDHDATASRVMRQALPRTVRETGGAYGMHYPGLRKFGTRFFGRIGYVLIPDSRSIEVDSLEDLMVARWLAEHLDG